MRTYTSYLHAGCTILFAAILLMASPLLFATEERDWHFNGTVIEACSCPMFCPCYFNTKPALNHTEHGPKHFCKFNMAYKINEGYHGDTDLAGVKFWISGDLGADWKTGETEWAIITFHPGTSEAQKNGVATALAHIFPVKGQSFEVAEDADIEWQATEERAEAKLAKGNKAHIILNKWQGLAGKPGTLENIAYFGTPRNNGFTMMPNEIETWKVGDRGFEFKGTTGFMITIDMKSSDLAI